VLAPRDDRLFPLAFQRRIVHERLGLPVEEMSGGHVPMLARPRELADRLTAVTARSAGRSSPLLSGGVMDDHVGVSGFDDEG